MYVCIYLCMYVRTHVFVRYVGMYMAMLVMEVLREPFGRSFVFFFIRCPGPALNLIKHS